MNYIGQLIGILAIIVSFFIYIQPTRYRMVFLKLVTDFLWVAHHISIFSYTAAATTGISIVRELVFLPKRKEGHVTPILIVFSVLFVGASILTWKDNFSVLPAAASVLATIAFASTGIRNIRIFSFMSSVCMFVYGIHYFSVPTVINEILVEGSIIISFVREQKKKG